MKINTKVRYGLKALVYISRNATDKKLVRIKEISEDQNISIQYLEQILFKLKNENIIEGKRGPNGGYRLISEPETLDLYRIYSILDDESKIVDCNESEESKKNCEPDYCEYSCIWNRLDNAMKKILSSTTLADFLKESKDVGENID